MAIKHSVHVIQKTDQTQKLLRRHNALAEAARLALKTLEGLEHDGTIRLPNKSYEDTVAALRKAL
jgi:glucuronate isomerase